MSNETPQVYTMYVPKRTDKPEMVWNWMAPSRNLAHSHIINNTSYPHFYTIVKVQVTEIE